MTMRMTMRMTMQFIWSDESRPQTQFSITAIAGRHSLIAAKFSGFICGKLAAEPSAWTLAGNFALPASLPRRPVSWQSLLNCPLDYTSQVILRAKGASTSGRFFVKFAPVKRRNLRVHGKFYLGKAGIGEAGGRRQAAAFVTWIDRPQPRLPGRGLPMVPIREGLKMPGVARSIASWGGQTQIGRVFPAPTRPPPEK